MLLIIDRSQKNARIYAEIFHYMGILTLSATPERALCSRDRRCRAILIPDPEGLSDMEDYLTRLHTYAGETPIFALYKGKKDDAYAALFDDLYPENVSSARLIAGIISYQQARGLPALGDYRLAGIDAVPTHAEVRYYDRPIALTKTETMILRYLIRAYPDGSPAQEIMARAYRPSRAPEISNIRTHISTINRKFRETFGQNIICMMSKSGYVIRTSENGMTSESPEDSETHDVKEPATV